jgi:plasmid stabilization system protein ParE
MDGQGKKYEVVITESAERAYFDILDYLFKRYSENRANSIALGLLNAPLRLIEFPEQGALEQALVGQKRTYRFILFERHKDATIKVIYFIDDTILKVYVTDFFPTEMNPSRVTRTRS